MQDNIESIYGRDALLIYLKDVRDLEVMKKLLSDKILKGDQRVKEFENKYLIPNQLQPIKRKRVILMWIVLIYILIAIVIGLVPAIGAGKSFSTIIPLAIICLILFLLIKRRKAADKKVVDAHNEEDTERIRKNSIIFERDYNEPWNRARPLLIEAWKNVDAALKENYALNIIPGQYRKLESALYLYEFMSTAQQPFSQALDHAQIDEGIKQIVSRLDHIIRQNEEQLRQLYAIRSNTETLIKQANAILVAQVATAYYARSASVHSKAVHAQMDAMNQYKRWGF